MPGSANTISRRFHAGLSEMPSPNADTPASGSSISSGHVLIVEDDDAHAYLIEHLLWLQPNVKRVDRAASGEEALAYLEQRLDARALPDMVLVDLNMPGMGGLDLVRLVRKKAQRLPLIILSTSERQEDLEAAYRAKATAYLTKPIGAVAFTKMIESLASYWLGQRQWLR